MSSFLLQWSWSLFGVYVAAILASIWEMQLARSTGKTLSYSAHQWHLATAQNPALSHPIQVYGETVVTPWLVVVLYRLPNQYFKRALVIPADSLNSHQHRQLRVRLRFSRAVIHH
ncbi:hypothetical protein AKN90_00725 [Thiopseudomonas alkaliphila]|uniref:Uncharacterized protein n=2 Tax=Thiopseudomonas alkaliphila TaxID=1697053 RepID=A0A0K1XB59_9GAMM|nr:protein YgfX [Thiopseudomonas alkaliphila]AKX54407.1 hypothetical protein AKN90_00725 [Thiopseudomonas alkaliphila]AKX58610.1 hypothetical protein AKN88_00640 [Thiopseudomonas alkaliphila]MDM1696278.1 hypothetical protein [Thiopseudomonas alkaliphila]